MSSLSSKINSFTRKKKDRDYDERYNREDIYDDNNNDIEYKNTSSIESSLDSSRLAGDWNDVIDISRQLHDMLNSENDDDSKEHDRDKKKEDTGKDKKSNRLRKRDIIRNIYLRNTSSRPATSIVQRDNDDNHDKVNNKQHKHLNDTSDMESSIEKLCLSYASFIQAYNALGDKYETDYIEYIHKSLPYIEHIYNDKNDIISSQSQTDTSVKSRVTSIDLIYQHVLVLLNLDIDEDIANASNTSDSNISNRNNNNSIDNNVTENAYHMLQSIEYHNLTAKQQQYWNSTIRSTYTYRYSTYIKALALYASLAMELKKHDEALRIYTMIVDILIDKYVIHNENNETLRKDDKLNTPTSISSLSSTVPTIVYHELFISMIEIPKLLALTNKHDLSEKFKHDIMMNPPKLLPTAIRVKLQQKWSTTLNMNVHNNEYKNEEVRLIPLDAQKLLLYMLRHSTSETSSIERQYVLNKHYDKLITHFRNHITKNYMNFYLWLALILTLLSSKQCSEAYLVIKQALYRNRNHVLLLLLSAKLCANQLYRDRQAVEYCKNALEELLQLNDNNDNNTTDMKSAKQSIVQSGIGGDPHDNISPHATDERKDVENEQKQHNKEINETIEHRNKQSINEDSNPSLTRNNDTEQTSTSVRPSYNLQQNTDDTLLHNTAHNVNSDDENTVDNTDPYLGYSNQQLLLYTYVLYGISLGKLSYHYTYTWKERQKYRSQAIEYLQNAYSMDSQNIHITLQLSILYADIYDIADSMELCKYVCNNDRHNVNALHLLALLLTSKEQYEDALIVINHATSLQIHTHTSTLQSTYNTDIYIHLQSLLTKSKILCKLHRYEESMHTLIDGCKLLFNDNQYIVRHTTSSNNDNDTITHVKVNINNNDILTFKHEYTSEYISTPPALNRDIPIHKHNNAVELMLHIADTYIQYSTAYPSDKLHELAISAVQSASILCNDNMDKSELYYTMGNIAVYNRDYMEASELYKESLHYNNNNINTLISLSELYYNADTSINDSVAISYIKSVIEIDPTRFQAWYMYGKLVERQQQNNNINTNSRSDDAQQYLSVSKQLKSNTPIRSFIHVSRNID